MYIRFLEYTNMGEYYGQGKFVGKMFVNSLRDRGSIQGRVIPKAQKMVIDTSLLTTQDYKHSIEGTVV